MGNDNLAFGVFGAVMIFLSIMLASVLSKPQYSMRCYHNVNEPHAPVEMMLDKRFGKVLLLQTTSGICIPAGDIPSDGR